MQLIHLIIQSIHDTSIAKLIFSISYVTSSSIVHKVLNDSSHTYGIHFKFCFHHYVLRGEMTKTRSHLYMF
jgi:hypothetical protein